MATVAWDRLLETYCCNKAETALLIPGGAPLLRIGEDWRALMLPTLDAGDVKEMASKMLTEWIDGAADGYSYRDFWYGNVAFFRIMAFGYPNATAVVVSHRTPTHPAPEQTMKSKDGPSGM